MCLAIPGKIASIDGGNLAQVDIMGIVRTVSLDLLPQAKVGDYVLVHAGFGIEIVDEESVNETLELIEQMAQLSGIDLHEGMGEGEAPEAQAAAAPSPTSSPAER